MKSSHAFKLLIVILLGLIVFAIFPYAKGRLDALRQQKTNTAPQNVSTPVLPASHVVEEPGTIAVSGKQWGQSTCYIGAVEGSSRFNIADLQDLGINTYRVFGGMPRWEAQDDDGVYGLPTIDQIKNNPNVINWSHWDKVMTDPPGGSDYWWDPSNPKWYGNARTLFSTLNAAHIRTVIALRNQDDQHNPSWAPNPPTTSADWNEWWEHVFALVYWLNVRNHYNINDFEIYNEPNIHEQGWKGSEAQYFTFAKYTHDAIDYVYRTYLPGQTYSLFAPVSSGSSWPRDALQDIPDYFNTMDIHIYGNIPGAVEQVHYWMNSAGHSDYPLWLTEWGSYKNQYNSVPFGISLINNLIYGSRPGNDYVYGSHIFSLYDFDKQPYGLINYNGVPRVDYYAVRMAIRALQGCRPTYRSITSNKDLLAITTRDAHDQLYLLVTNQNNAVRYTVNTDLSNLIARGSGSIWQFDSSHMDTIVSTQALKNGHLTLSIPASGAILIKLTRPQQNIK